jgi:hypothetical protein
MEDEKVAVAVRREVAELASGFPVPGVPDAARG